MKGKAQKPQTDGTTETVIALPADFRLSALDAVKAELATAGAARTVHIDASIVERVDTGALQLLFVFVRARRANGAETVWKGVADALRDAARVLGLTDELALPAPLPA